MKINQVGSNCTIVALSNGDQIGFSYETPVVAKVDGVTYRTIQFYSATTSKHCTQLLNQMTGSFGGPRPQEFFDELGARA